MVTFRFLPEWAVLIPLCAWPATAVGQTRWSVATPSLPFYSHCVAVYDAAAGRAIVVSPSATWAVASGTGVWTQVTGPTPGPYWTEAAVAYDALRQRVVLFGGFGGAGNALASTRELAGAAWQQPALSVVPPARHGAGMCFDAQAGVVRLVAGDAAPYAATTQPLADVWTFDGVQWTQLPPSPIGPVGPTAMAFDSARARCVAWAPNGTFEWVGGAFVPVPTTNAPPPRRSAAFVYDALRGRIVLHGGRDPGTTTRSDVWEYDGVDWQQRQPLGVFARRHWHGMVYDPELQVVRAFAGLETLVSIGGLITTNFSHNEELHYEPVSAPIVQVFDQGCYFATSLAAVGLPWLGEVFTLQMAVAGTGIPPLMVFGSSSEQFGTTPLPFPIDFLGFPNCELLVSPDVLVLPVVSGTIGSVAVPIPNQVQLLGVRLYVQGFEPGLTGNGTGTWGLLVQVGAR